MDYSFRKPGDVATLSTLVNVDSYGNASVEVDTAVPIISGKLSVGLGGTGLKNEFYNGTDSWSHNEAISLGWRPTDTIEILVRSTEPGL